MRTHKHTSTICSCQSIHSLQNLKSIRESMSGQIEWGAQGGPGWILKYIQAIWGLA